MKPCLNMLNSTALDDFQIDFLSGKLRYRFDHLQGRNELVIKAIGWKKNQPLQVFDTTAGLGREAFLMAGLGCEVTLFERHPVIAQLLKEALTNAAHCETLAPVIARMTFIPGCAIQYLQDQPLSRVQAPEVIYCDPMFAPRTKSALVKKEMQLLQNLIGEDPDGEQLVTLALGIAKKRVVVKRPLSAHPFIEKPHCVFKAKSHRFDVYIVKD